MSFSILYKPLEVYLSKKALHLPGNIPVMNMNTQIN